MGFVGVCRIDFQCNSYPSNSCQKNQPSQKLKRGSTAVHSNGVFMGFHVPLGEVRVNPNI